MIFHIFWLYIFWLYGFRVSFILTFGFRIWVVLIFVVTWICEENSPIILALTSLQFWSGTVSISRVTCRTEFAICFSVGALYGWEFYNICLSKYLQSSGNCENYKTVGKCEFAKGIDFSFTFILQTWHWPSSRILFRRISIRRWSRTGPENNQRKRHPRNKSRKITDCL